MPPRNLIFLHVPKAAGSTLTPIIHRQYDDEEIHHISVEPSVPESVEAFTTLPPTERDDIRCLTGHGPFGLHEYLEGPTEYITMLRDPVERVLSGYYYIWESPGHRLHSDLVENRVSLQQFIENEMSPLVGNGMTRQIAGDRATPPCRETLDKAIRRVKNHFGIVGLVERFDESLLLMQRRYGWTDTTYRKRNVTSDRPGKRDVQDGILELIRERNQLDIELYRWAKSRFEEKVSKEDLGTGLRLHRLRCKAYSAVKYWTENARHVKRTLFSH